MISAWWLLLIVPAALALGVYAGWRLFDRVAALWLVDYWWTRGL